MKYGRAMVKSRSLGGSTHPDWSSTFTEPTNYGTKGERYLTPFYVLYLKIGIMIVSDS